MMQGAQTFGAEQHHLMAQNALLSQHNMTMGHVGGHINQGDGFVSSASSINSGGLGMDGNTTPRNARPRKRFHLS